jgi:hypothetical protein
MCLYIKQDQKENNKDLKKWFGRRTKFAYVYKVLGKKQDESFYRSIHFPNFIWDFNKQKIFKVNRSSKPTKEELKWKGLHVFTSFRVAKIFTDYMRGEEIAKFKVSDEDIVAVENKLYHQFSSEELVCTRLEFVEIVKN